MEVSTADLEIGNVCCWPLDEGRLAHGAARPPARRDLRARPGHGARRARLQEPRRQPFLRPGGLQRLQPRRRDPSGQHHLFLPSSTLPGGQPQRQLQRCLPPPPDDLRRRGPELRALLRCRHDAGLGNGRRQPRRAERERLQHPALRPYLRAAGRGRRQLLRHRHGHLQFLASGGTPSVNRVTTTSAPPAAGANASSEAPPGSTSGLSPARGSAAPLRSRTDAPLRCSTRTAEALAPRVRVSSPTRPPEALATIRADETTCTPRRSAVERPANAGAVQSSRTERRARRMSPKLRLLSTSGKTADGMGFIRTPDLSAVA